MSGRRRLVVEADGGSRGNPGVAGYGALVRDPDTGAILVERAAPLGKASNNVAEYTGLIRGLEAAQRLSPGADVDVRMDSKLVVEQMAGRWKIKHEDMRRLALEAKDVCAQIARDGGSVTFAWIPREKNKDADRLSNDGMDGRTIDRVLVDTADDAEATDADATDAVDAAEPTADATPAGEQPAPDLARPVRLVLVRHGVTAHTTSGRVDGRGGTDPGLSPQGQAQAEALGRRLRVWLADTPVTVVTSSLPRAVGTGARIGAALGVEPVVDDGWDEQSFGVWDGRSVAQIGARWPDDLARLRTDPAFAPDGGETHEQVAERVEGAYERALELAGPGEAVVVVAHRKPVFLALATALGLSFDAYWTLAISPGSISEIDVWADGGVLVRCINDAAHLG